MPAYVFTYWSIDMDDVPENYRDTLSPDDGYFEQVGVNAPTISEAVEFFEGRHGWESTHVRSITYLGPGIKGHRGFFDVNNPNRSLGYFAKALPRDVELA